MKILKSKIKYTFIVILLISLFLIVYHQVKASSISSGIENFPETYKPYLSEIVKKHPNWNFVAMYTNLDWNYVISKENKFGVNLVPKNYSDAWKNTNENEYNIEVDNGWVDSSKRAVEYCMDPRNFLNEIRIFQFEELSYNEYSNSLNGIEKILYGTEFYEKTVSYLNSNGNTISTNYKYSDLILKASQISSVSPYHLASRIKQEVGPFLTHKSISGDVEGYEGLYNFYNIGATSSENKMETIKNGLLYAKNGKSATEEIKNKYLIPWNTKEKAITGGAIFIGSSYINVGQNTIYLQKFDVNDERENILFWHQYMTNILAPYSESKSIYNGYSKSGLLNTPMTFIIPIFTNMPQIPADNPNINLDEFIEDNKNVYCNATNVNLRSGPNTSYEVITTVSKDSNMIRLLKGNQFGDKWDKVILENGIIGYMYQLYVSEKPENILENPQELESIFLEPLKVQLNEISGINYNDNYVSTIKQKIITNYDVEIVNQKNEILNDKDKLGTGSKIIIKDNEEIIGVYEIILYGDVNGDGKINSIDLLVLQRHILEIEKISGIYLKAGNIYKNGKNPTSVDLLLIQRHILGIKLIEQ